MDKKLRITGKILMALLLVLCGLFFQNFTKKDQSKTLQQQVVKRGIKPGQLKIAIYKKDRLMKIFFKQEELISYPCVLGFAPTGDKTQEGDGKTPEGDFGIRSMYAHKSWSYFIWVDYPNAVSKQRFADRKKKKIIPKSARIGGEIGIHGVPDGCDYLIDQGSDWTLGCISLKTAHITDLYKSISAATKISIYP